MRVVVRDTYSALNPIRHCTEANGPHEDVTKLLQHYAETDF